MTHTSSAGRTRIVAGPDSQRDADEGRIRLIMPGDKKQNVPTVQKARRHERPKRSFTEKHPSWVVASRPTSKWSVRQLLWLFWVVTRAYKLEWIPAPRAYGSYRWAAAENIDYVRSVKSTCMAIIAVASRKGGTGKTTIATWINALFQLSIDMVSTLLDLDSGSDAAGGRYGVVPGNGRLTSLDVFRMILRFKWQPHKQDLTRKVAYHELSQAYVIPHAIDLDVAPAETAQVALTLKRATDVLVLDCAPGVKEKSTEGAILASSVPIITARLNVKDDMDAVSLALSHEPYKLRKRLGRGGDVIIVLSGVKWLDFNLRTQYREAERFDVRPDQVVLIPYSKYLYNSKPVDPQYVSAKVMFSMTKLLRTVAEAAVRYNTAHPARPLPGENPEDAPPAPPMEQGSNHTATSADLNQSSVTADAH